MWDIEEIEEANPLLLLHLRRCGAIHEAFLCEAAEELSGRSEPHAAVFFQVPHPVSTDAEWFRIKTLERGVYADVKTQLMTLELSQSIELGVGALTLDEAQECGGPVFTQFMAIIPLWGSRLSFYSRYAECFDGVALKDRIVVRPEENWMFRDRLVAMTASVFEANMARKLVGEMRVMLRRLLPSYSIASMSEAPQPQWLLNYFVMPIAGRLVAHRPPVPTASVLLQRRTTRPASMVSGQHLSALSSGIQREPSKFEQQLFAMNRLRDEGETTLALVGVLSLIEWFIARHLRAGAPAGEHQPALGYLLKKTDALAFLDGPTRAILLDAIAIRHRFVHGSPPSRKSVTNGNEMDAGRESFDLDASHVEVVERLISAAFSIYKAINEKSNSST